MSLVIRLICGVWMVRKNREKKEYDLRETLRERET